jgi:hypothetical protein
MVVYHNNAQALADAMRQRRKELTSVDGTQGISQKEVPLRGRLGKYPTRITVARYELRQIPEKPSSRVLGDIDIAYGWPVGTARSILNGALLPESVEETGAPVISTDTEPLPEPVAKPSSDVHTEGDNLARLRQYVRAVSNMRRTLVEELPHLPDPVRNALDEVNETQTDLLLELTDRLSKESS